MQLGLSYPKFYIYDSTNTTLVETITLQRFVGNTHGAPQSGEYIVNTSPFSGVRKQTFKGYRINDSIKVFSPERWATILAYQAAVNNDDVEPDTSKATRIVDYCNAGYTIRYVPHVDLEDIYGYTYSLVHVTISDFGYGLRSHSDQITINVVGVSRETYWTPFRKFDMVNCIDFDGVNDNVSFTLTSIGTTHTIEFWLDASNKDFLICSRTGGTGGVQFDSTDKIYYSGNSTSQASKSITALSPGTKHHFAITRNNSTTITFYQNGASLGTSTISANTALSLSAIGYRADVASLYYDGKLGLFRIYQSALTAEQIKRQYNGGYGNPPLDVPAYLIHEYDGTGGTSTSETDQSGSGLTGTLNNGVTRTTW